MIDYMATVPRGLGDSELRNFARELERENQKLRTSLLKTTGSLGLIIGGAGAQAIGHKENYALAKKTLEETFHE